MLGPQAGDARSAGLIALVGTALAALPLLVWLRYSEEIVSAGGLAAFVEAAAGRRLALAQAAVWTFSYVLYLPYTVTQVVYDVLVIIFPGIHPWRWVLELTIPLALVALVLLGTKPVLQLLLASAALQLVLALVLGAVEIGHAGIPSSTITSTHHVLRGSADIGLLFVCGSLPLFLGAEVVGGSRTIRRSLLGAWAVVGAYLIFTMLPLAAVSPGLRDADLPGYAIANAYSGRTLAVVIGLGTVVSILGVIVAEYLALSRLVFAVTRVPIRTVLKWIAVPFVALDAISLLNPDEFYDKAIRPSLIALFIAELIVIIAFPLYRARRGKLGAIDVLIALGATTLFAWGLYQAISSSVSS